MTTPRCDGCRFWWADTRDTLVGEQAGEDDVCQCRRRAPLPGEPLRGAAMWPLTHAGDWCGEWQAADEPAPDTAGLTLDSFGFSARVRNVLCLLGIDSLQDLLATEARTLLGERNFAGGSLAEVRQKLAAKGLRLADRPRRPQP